MSSNQPNLDTVTTINDDGSRNFVHPADVKGRFTTLRAISGYIILAVYVLFPCIPINGYPAVFFDFAHRQLHLFGFTFLSQDFWLAFFLITGLGFTLFYVTALWGRIWCGWACPQTVLIEQIFRRIERLIEGDSRARRTLDNSAWTPDKVVKRSAKYFIFFLLAWIISHIFISYFVSMHDLMKMMQESPSENWGLFLFVMALTAALLFDFIWFREQFCIVLCPYGRLQSVLIDDDSVVIGYDKKRGEPRGKPSTEGTGDCVDCHRCVAVCPTGIDIRQGLQIECIGCSNCVDACDQIMDKLKRPRGLIRYDSAHGFDGQKTKVIRPRIILYTFLLVLGAVVMTLSLSTFKSATVTLVRAIGAPYYLTEEGVRNQYLLRVFNKQTHPMTFNLRVAKGPTSLKTSGLEHSIEIPPLGEVKVNLTAVMPKGTYTGPFSFEVETVSEKFSNTQALPFLGPTLAQ